MISHRHPEEWQDQYAVGSRTPRGEAQIPRGELEAGTIRTVGHTEQGRRLGSQGSPSGGIPKCHKPTLMWIKKLTLPSNEHNIIIAIK